MPWVRFDDQYPINRKVDGLSDAAFRLHTSAIFWSARNLTDGFLPEEDLGSVAARVRRPYRFTAECVDRHTWHDANTSCTSPKCPASVDNRPERSGWIIHDYWEFQPSKAQVMKEREAAAIRQARWRAKHNGVSNGVSNAVSTAAPSRPAQGRERTPVPAAGARASPAPPRQPNPKPAWCGYCNQRTRIVDADPPYRCPACHPLGGTPPR